MEEIIEFVANNYAWFLTITIVLIFALIGYIYDAKKNSADLVKKQEDELNEEIMDNLVSLEGKSLAETVMSSKKINSETKQVELTDESILNEETSDNNLNDNNMSNPNNND